MKERSIYSWFTPLLNNLEIFRKNLNLLIIESESASLQGIPNSTTALDVHDSKSILNMIEKFEEEDDDDVSNVFHNLEITDALIAEME